MSWGAAGTQQTKTKSVQCIVSIATRGHGDVDRHMFTQPIRAFGVLCWYCIQTMCINSMSCAMGGFVAELQLVNSHIKRYNAYISVSAFQMQH